MCLHERRIGGADVTVRFPREWLTDWRAVSEGIERLIGGFKPTVQLMIRARPACGRTLAVEIDVEDRQFENVGPAALLVSTNSTPTNSSPI